MARVLITGGSGFIGSHLLTRLMASDHELYNLDLQAPPAVVRDVPWQPGNILDRDGLDRVFREFRPTHVVHLAARTDLDGRTLADYAANTTGTRNVIEAALAAGSVERLITTSTQYVVRPGRRPTSPTDFDTYGAYGESKVETEKLTRALAGPLTWTIIRPTNIWGPRHPFLPPRVWYYIARGLYVHPGREPIRRSYARVDAVTWQIGAILDAPTATVNEQVFYVGETTVEFLEWANAFSYALRGAPVRVVPRPVWRALAAIGDVVPRFPMNSARFARMTTNDDPVIEPTYAAFGPPPGTFEAAVETTVEWLFEHWKSQGKTLTRPRSVTQASTA